MSKKFKCRAKDPKNCKKRGTGITSKPDNIIPIPKNPYAPKPVLPKMIERALTSDLDWQGEKPEWWGRLTKNFAESEYPETPKLIDVIELDGEKFAVIWCDSPPNERKRNRDTGYVTRELAMYSFDREPVTEQGINRTNTSCYLKLTSIENEKMDQVFGTDFYRYYKFEAEHNGVGYYDIDANSTEEEKQKAYLHSIGDYRMVLDEAPKGEDLEKKLKANVPNIRYKYDFLTEYQKYPFVDYSNVPDEYKNKGLGTAMYAYAGRILAKENKILSSSGLQTGEAVMLWQSLAKKFPDNIGKIEKEEMNGDKKQRFVLDFRKK